ncbi:MAG: hypothetical protein Q4C30_08560, partial [Bacteroidia bacterium]|nr:hypothetical protein [Bacteroidia bacterium]
EFKEALINISPHGRDSLNDTLSNIAIVIWGAWKANSSKGKVNLAYIAETIEKEKSINLAIYKDSPISVECMKILDSIHDLEYYVKGRMLYFRFGRCKGECPWSDTMEDQIINTPPKNKWDFFTLINY